MIGMKRRIVLGYSRSFSSPFSCSPNSGIEDWMGQALALSIHSLTTRKAAIVVFSEEEEQFFEAIC
jgi:hypothetical protein